MTRRRSSQLRVVGGGVSDRDILLAWHEAAAGGTADRIVDDLMTSITAELSASGLPNAKPAGVDDAILRDVLRGLIVAAMRRNLIRRLIAARERPALLAGKTQRQRLAYLVTGEDHAL